LQNTTREDLMDHQAGNSLLAQLRALAGPPPDEDALDSELVGLFLNQHSEAAFNVLVRRHGPMVLGLCRRLLRNEQDAEDAFQATFLVLARKLHRLRKLGSLASFLYGIARRVCGKARTAQARRRAREAQLPPAAQGDPLTEMTVAEAQGIVDEELSRLPERFRAPLVLCCLEGLARDEAARQLGWSVALVKCRLEQARELLRRRLAGRGLALPAGLLVVGLFGASTAVAAPWPR
jgi:RNA polymerase sigma factor (sigma-70 family)